MVDHASLETGLTSGAGGGGILGEERRKKKKTQMDKRDEEMWGCVGTEGVSVVTDY